MKDRDFDMEKTKLAGGLLGIGSVVVAATIGTCIGLAIGKNSVKTKEGQMQPTETYIEATEETNIADQLISTAQQGEEKTFEKGEHYICVRIPHHSKYLGINNPNENDELDVFAINNIPEGYEIYSITSYTSKIGAGSSTAGYDVWLVNTEKVKVIATYNNQTKQYGYYTFGKVVEKEKQLIK